MTIRAKILLGLLFVSIVPLLLFGTWFAQKDLRSRETDFARMELEHAETIMHSLSTYFSIELQHLQDEAQERLGVATVRKDSAHLAKEARHLALAGDMESVFLVDPSGTITFSTRPAEAGTSITTEAWFQAALRGEKAFGEVKRDEASGRAVIPLAVPIFRDSGSRTPVGVMAALYRWDEVGKLLGKFQIRGLPQDEANHFMLTDRNGLVIWCFDPSEILSHNLIEAGMISAREARAGREGYIRETSEHGLPSFSVYTHFKADAGEPDPGWLLVALHDPEGIFSAVKERNRNFYLLLCSAAAILILLALRLSAEIARPLREITHAIQKFTPESAGEKVTIQASGEAGVLVEAFNGMVERLARSKVELWESKEIFQNLFDSSPVGICMTDYGDRILAANPECCRITKYSHDRLLGMMVTDIQAPSVRAKSGTAIKGALDDHNGAPITTRLLRADGSEILIEIMTTRLDKNRAISVIRDLSGETRARAEIAKLLRAVEQSHSIIMITDRKGVIEYVNQKFTEVTGFAEEEAIGQKPSILKSGRHDATFYTEIWTTIGAGRTWQGELCNRRKNGEFYWETAVISPVIDENGRLTHIVGVKLDITEMRNLEGEVRQAEKLAALGRLTAGVSHEMSQPLNAIKNFCQGIILNMEENIPVTPERLKENLSRAIDQVDRMAEIIKNMRVYTRKDETARSAVDLNAVAVYPFSFLGAQLRSRGISCDMQLHTEPLPVFINENRFQQVFINIVVNARDAILSRVTPDGGRITIASAPDGEKWVAVEVKDNGVGMTEEETKRIFEPFYTTKGPDQGTGLGLSLSYEIVRMHKGEISVQSAVGEGTVFKIRLPRAPAHSKENG